MAKWRENAIPLDEPQEGWRGKAIALDEPPAPSRMDFSLGGQRITPAEAGKRATEVFKAATKGRIPLAVAEATVPYPGREIPPELLSGVDIPTLESIQNRPMDWQYPAEKLEPGWVKRWEGFVAAGAGIAGTTPHGALLLHKVLVPWMERNVPGSGKNLLSAISEQMAARRATQYRVAEWIPEQVPFFGKGQDPVAALFTLWMNIGLTGAVGEVVAPGAVPTGPALAPPPVPATAGAVAAAVSKQGAHTAGLLGSMAFTHELNRTGDVGQALEVGSQTALIGMGIGLAFGTILNAGQIRVLARNHAYIKAQVDVMEAAQESDPKPFLEALQRGIRVGRSIYKEQGDATGVAACDGTLMRLSQYEKASRAMDLRTEMQAWGTIRPLNELPELMLPAPPVVEPWFQVPAKRAPSMGPSGMARVAPTAPVPPVAPMPAAAPIAALAAPVQPSPPAEAKEGLPKIVYHATTAQFEGLPTRAIGRGGGFFARGEPEGIFYSSSPEGIPGGADVFGRPGIRIITARPTSQNPFVVTESTLSEYYAREDYVIEAWLAEAAEISGRETAETFAERDAQGRLINFTGDKMWKGHTQGFPDWSIAERLAEEYRADGYDAIWDTLNNNYIVLRPEAVEAPPAAETLIPAGEPLFAAPEAAAAKEPWEMTRGEWLQLEAQDANRRGTRSRMDDYLGSVQDASPGYLERLDATTIELAEAEGVYEKIYTPEREHKAVLVLALREGKPVPPEVLADYPDLAKLEAAPQAPPSATPGPAAAKAAPAAGAVEPKVRELLGGQTTRVVGTVQHEGISYRLRATHLYKTGLIQFSIAPEGTNKWQAFSGKIADDDTLSHAQEVVGSALSESAVIAWHGIPSKVEAPSPKPVPQAKPKAAAIALQRAAENPRQPGVWKQEGDQFTFRFRTPKTAAGGEAYNALLAKMDSLGYRPKFEPNGRIWFEPTAPAKQAPAVGAEAKVARGTRPPAPRIVVGPDGKLYGTLSNEAQDLLNSMRGAAPLPGGAPAVFRDDASNGYARKLYDELIGAGKLEIVELNPVTQSRLLRVKAEKAKPPVAPAPKVAPPTKPRALPTAPAGLLDEFLKSETGAMTEEVLPVGVKIERDRLQQRAERAEKQPRIVIDRKPKDLGMIQKYIGSLSNQARNSGNPDVVRAADVLVNGNMEMVNHIAADAADAEAHYRALPREYRKNHGQKFFALMDQKLSPAEIDASAEIPEAVKGPLKYFKRLSEERRQEIIRIKRERATAAYEGSNVEALAEIVKAKGLPFEAVAAEERKAFRPGFISTETGEPATRGEVAKALAESDVPDDWGLQWGHILHTWFGQYELTFTDAQGEKHFIDRAETQSEAYLKLDAFRKAHPEIGIDSLNASAEFILPPEVLRVSRNRYFVLLSQLQESADADAAEVKAALRGVVGRKEFRQKYMPQLMHRWGKEGYSENFRRVWFAETYQFWRWKYLTDINRQVQPLIEKVKRANQPRWAAHLEEALQYAWGSGRSAASAAFDERVQRIPVLGTYIKPFALERWAGRIKGIQYFSKLQTGKFYVLNTLQLMQTLYPVVKERGLYRGVSLYYSKEGKEILRRHNVLASQGKLRETRMIRPGRLGQFTPAGASEMRNQAVAFLALYDHGINTLGLSDAQAAEYGRLRGQVFTQFAYVPVDVPKIMRGPIGGTIFQFKRFSVKQLEMVSRMIRDRDIGGVGRWLTVQAILGGTRVAWKVAKLVGYGWLGYQLYKWIKEKYGEDTARVLAFGLPALIGVDLSGSIDPTQIIQEGQNIPETIGNILLGPTGSDIIRAATILGESKTATERTLLGRAEAIVAERSPTYQQFDALRRLMQQDTNRLDAKGRLQYRETWGTLWREALAFRPVEKSEERLMLDAALALKEYRDKVLDEAAAVYMSTQDLDAAAKKLEQWNGMFPETPLNTLDLYFRLSGREGWADKTATERLLQQMPQEIRDIIGESADKQ